MIDSIHSIAIFQGIVTGFVLLFLKRNGKRDSKYLALFLLFLSLAIANESYGDYVNEEFHLLYPFTFFLLLPNLIYLHIDSKITGSSTRKNLIINLLPGIIEFGFLILVLLLVEFSVINSESEFLYYFDEIYNYLTIGYTIFIQAIILKKIAFYNKRLYDYKSTIHYKYLNWLKWACIVIIANEVYYSMFYLLSNELEPSNKTYAVYAIIELALISYIGIGALLQVNLKIDVPDEHPKVQELDNMNSDGTKEISKQKIDSLFAEIEAYMKTKKPFLDPDLNLKSLAEDIKISERQISNAINQNFGQNFYSYVNTYRVETVKTMFANSVQEKYSIVGIGEAAGFNSKSSFYINFKKVTGISPSQYIKEIS